MCRRICFVRQISIVMSSGRFGDAAKHPQSHSQKIGEVYDGSRNGYHGATHVVGYNLCKRGKQESTEGGGRLMPIVVWWAICLFVILVLTLIAPDWAKQIGDRDSSDLDHFGRRW